MDHTIAESGMSVSELARINAHFVQYDEKDSNAQEKAPWRPVDGWENPIWGWVLVNYADSGLQFFLYDGSFYREVRLVGPRGAQASPEWLPFAPPKQNSATPGTGDPEKAAKMNQLDRLIEKMVDREYLQEFVNMITDATQNSPAAPTTHAEFSNAMASRPLALVDMGFSLELTIDALKAQSSLEATSSVPPPTLLGDEAQRELYEFPVKIGDGKRQFDGLVAYFQPEDTPTTSSQLKLNEFYSFSKADFATQPGSPKLGVESDPAAIEEKPTKYRVNSYPYPKLKPFWISPDTPHANEGTPTTTEWNSDYVRRHSRLRNSKLSVFGALIDPSLPVNLFSSVLPTTSLALPPWTWQQAMQKMTTFFHAGPLLLTGDVSDFVPEDNHNLEDPDLLFKTAPVEIPTLEGGDWAWLQPYVAK